MERQTVHLYVCDTLADWEPGFAISGLNNPDMQTQPGRFRVQTVAARPEPVTTLGGMRILPDLTLDALAPSDSALLILPGAETWDGDAHAAALAKAKEFVAAGVPVAAICGATVGLARAGLLDERRHTSNDARYLAATGYGGTALYEEQPAVCDGNVITATTTAPVAFAYEIFKLLDVYPSAVLEEWYALFTTGDPAHFFAMMRAAAS